MAHEQILFDEASHTYRVGGRIYPGVTSIIQSVGLTPDFSKIPPEVLDYKRALGTEVHKIIELDLQDNLGEYDPVLEPYVSAWRQFRVDMRIRLIDTETPVYSKTHGYAGKLDLLAYFNGEEEGLFDFKTTSVIDLHCVSPQLWAYDLAYREWKGMTRKRPYKCFAVQLLSNGKYKLFPCTNKSSIDIFLYALQIYKWKQIGGKALNG